jgi:hypothetical protein
MGGAGWTTLIDGGRLIGNMDPVIPTAEPMGAIPTVRYMPKLWETACLEMGLVSAAAGKTPGYPPPAGPAPPARRSALRWA